MISTIAFCLLAQSHALLAPVASDRPNGFGLCGMLGNVREFCSTGYGEYTKGPVTDPTGGDEKRGFAVCRGSWSNDPRATPQR